MKHFDFHQPTKLYFGRSRITVLGSIAKEFGRRVLLVTISADSKELKNQYDRVKNILLQSGCEVTHFDSVVANPTVECISEGAKMAKECGAEAIVGLGGGSAMDSAKAISVEATHPGTCWDYLFYKNPQPDPAVLIPVIAVTTTSGTGSHVTQVAVVTNSAEKDKSALCNNILFPKVAIIDPELMLTLPAFTTACTGFDSFCHAFESLLNRKKGAYSNLLAWETIRIVIKNLPKVLKNLKEITYRESMAWADTMAGISIAVAGVTLPHSIGMAIGGMYPHVAHGEALAIVYPVFTSFTWKSAIPEFAELARILNPELKKYPDTEAASKTTEEVSGFLEVIGLRKSLIDINMPQLEIEALARQSMVLPDYKNNPRVADEMEMREIIEACYPVKVMPDMHY